LTELTPEFIHTWKASLSQSYKPATVHKYLSRLDGALKFAVVCGWLPRNPLAQLRKPSCGEGRVRYLTEDERQRLLAACRQSRNPLLYAVVMVALGTGGRKNEIRRLRREQVDLPGEQVRFVKTTSHRARAVPVVGETLATLTALAQHRRYDVPWGFPSWRGKEPVAIDSAWETARNHAQIEDFHFHDLRHTFASYMAMSGATLREIADVLGHTNIQMTLRYTHLMPSHIRTVVERMSQQFLAPWPAEEDTDD
jgi:integrase